MIRRRGLILFAASLSIFGAPAQDASAQVKSANPPKPDRSGFTDHLGNPGGANDRTGGLFRLPKLPTAIEQMQCHMGECSWEQIVSIEDIGHRGREVLRAVHSRSATTQTPDGQDYPTRLDAHAHVTWTESTSYVLCSLHRPASIWWDSDSRSYIEAPLHVVSPSGYEQSAVAEYLLACHGFGPDADKAAHPAELGYFDRASDSSQTRISDPKQVLRSTDDREK